MPGHDDTPPTWSDDPSGEHGGSFWERAAAPTPSSAETHAPEEPEVKAGVTPPAEMGPDLPPPANWLDLLKSIVLIGMAHVSASMGLVLFLVASGGHNVLAGAELEVDHLEPLAVLAYGLATSAITILVLWYFACRKYAFSFRRGFVLTSVDAATVYQSAAIGFVAAFVVALMSSLVSTGDSYMARLTANPRGLLVVSVLAVLLPPVEELQYRGFIFPIIRRHAGKATAIIITSIWFTGAHAFQLAGDWLALPFIFGVALVLTVQRQITGSLTPPMISHWVYNGTLVLMTLAALRF